MLRGVSRIESPKLIAARMSPSMSKSPRKYASPKAKSFGGTNIRRNAPARFSTRVNRGDTFASGSIVSPFQKRIAKSRGRMFARIERLDATARSACIA